MIYIPILHWGHSIITFALRGRWVHQNANASKQGDGGIISMGTFADNFL